MAYVNIISLIYYSVRMEGGHMILIFLAWGMEIFLLELPVQDRVFVPPLA